MNEISKTIPVDSFYIILSGLFIYQKKDINERNLNNNYIPWQNRIFDGNYSQTFNHLKYSYYDIYLNNIFPEVNEPSKERRSELGLLEHYTYKECIDKPEKYKGAKIVINTDKTLFFNIDFIDLYLFPHNIGIFSIKMTLQDEFQSIENISDFSNKIRLLYSNIQLLEGNEISLKHFFEQRIDDSIRLELNWDSYNPQLKSYIQIDLNNDLKHDERNQLIYDIGNVSPLGTSKGGKLLSPSKTYFETQMTENLVTVFDNWSALSLFDTFTRVSNKFQDEYRSWEYNYFNIYIHCLYSKFFLYLTSTKLSDITIVNKETAAIRDEFLEFINDELHSHISYKFLPNLLTEKLQNSLGIDKEVENMETKVQRINEHFQEKRENTLNIVISIIAFLSVFSSLYDFSEWMIKIGYPENYMFPYTSIFTGISIFSIILILIFRRANKKTIK
ncbi:MAG: hypothetical protein H8E98_00380 [Bacteroidetes bacterium]|nr:hypothetical protein [Bacteroidota bacterium]